MKSSDKRLPPSKNWQENIGGDEEARFASYAAAILKIQEANAKKLKCGRALHLKPHIGARAKLKVYDSIPMEAKVGIFAKEGEFDAWVRFSNGAVKRQVDKKPDVRGMAIKVLGVPGKKLISGQEDATTQDFSMIQGSAVSFGNSERFMFFTTRADSPIRLLFDACYKFGPVQTWRILRAVFESIGKKIDSLSKIHYWSALPISLGEYAVKYKLIPVGLSDVTDSTAQTADLGSELKDRLAAGPIEFELAFQFYCDAESTPIEDASIEWSETISPFVKVARLTLLQQDLRCSEGQRQEQYVESLAFDPWHAPIEFRPLGDLMRARGYIYRFSTAKRQALPEPVGIEEFDCLTHKTKVGL